MKREWYCLGAHERYVIDDEVDTVNDMLADIEAFCRTRIDRDDEEMRATTVDAAAVSFSRRMLAPVYFRG